MSQPSFSSSFAKNEAANIFHHMKLKHPRENKATTNKMESNLHKCPFCPYTSSAYNQISRHMTIRHYQEERYECKVCELFLPSQMALAEHNTLTHLNTNNFDMSLKSSIESTATHLYCPVCQNRLDVRSLLTDAGDHTCPTCNMVFSLELLMEKNFIPNFTPDESFNNFPSSSNRRQHLFEVQQVEEIYSESLNFPNDNNARFKDFGNPANDLNQAIQKGRIDFIEINDDDDDDDDVMRIDVDAAEKLGYPLRCTADAADKDPNPNSCLEKPRVPDRTNDLLTVSLNETFSNPGQPTSITHSNSSVSKRGRYVKLVSDFDDFEERPFACALCYQRYAQFPELSVHVQNHLTGAGRSGGDQSVDYFTW